MKMKDRVEAIEVYHWLIKKRANTHPTHVTHSTTNHIDALYENQAPSNEFWPWVVGVMIFTLVTMVFVVMVALGKVFKWKESHGRKYSLIKDTSQLIQKLYKKCKIEKDKEDNEYEQPVNTSDEVHIYDKGQRVSVMKKTKNAKEEESSLMAIDVMVHKGTYSEQALPCEPYIDFVETPIFSNSMVVANNVASFKELEKKMLNNSQENLLLVDFNSSKKHSLSEFRKHRATISSKGKKSQASDGFSWAKSLDDNVLVRRRKERNRRESLRRSRSCGDFSNDKSSNPQQLANMSTYTTILDDSPAKTEDTKVKKKRSEEEETLHAQRQHRLDLMQEQIEKLQKQHQRQTQMCEDTSALTRQEQQLHQLQQLEQQLQQLHQLIQPARPPLSAHTYAKIPELSSPTKSADKLSVIQKRPIPVPQELQYLPYDKRRRTTYNSTQSMHERGKAGRRLSDQFASFLSSSSGGTTHYAKIPDI